MITNIENAMKNIPYHGGNDNDLSASYLVENDFQAHSFNVNRTSPNLIIRCMRRNRCCASSAWAEDLSNPTPVNGYHFPPG